MEQQKTYMKAPKGMGSALIDGATYKVPKDGVVEVQQEGHKATLYRHGFTDHYVEAVDIEAQIEKMDNKDDLVEFIEERGGEADNDMSFKKLRRLALKAVGE